MSRSPRIYFVDFARSFAIVLALTDHSMNDFGIWQNYSFATFGILKTFTSSATPTFLLLFGMMLEIVYLKKLANGGMRRMASQLINRSFQCYLGYALTVFAGIMGGLLTLKGAIAALLFVGNCHFGNILKIYTVMLLLAIPLLWFRFRFGIAKTILIGFACWLVYPLYSYIPPLQDNIAIFTSYMFGFGGKGGPSVFNSLSLVVMGMLIANVVTTKSKKTFYTVSAGLFFTLVATIVMLFLIYPSQELIIGHLQNEFRWANHPFYYIISATMALLVTLVSSFLIPVGKPINKVVHEFLAFGRSSLTAFTAGNIILSLIVVSIAAYQWTLVAPILFIIVVYGILQFYEKIYPSLSVVTMIELRARRIRVGYYWFYVRRLSNVASGLFPMEHRHTYRHASSRKSVAEIAEKI